MTISSPTDDGFPVRCDVCGGASLVNVSRPPGDSVCPTCGSFLWVDAFAEITSRYQFVPDVRLPKVSPGSNTFVIEQVVDALAAPLGWTGAEAKWFQAAILKRENLGSTAIGHGVAVPHASVAWMNACATVLAYVPGGVDFEAPDGVQVHTIVMLASPIARPGDSLRILERIARSARDLGQSTV